MLGDGGAAGTADKAAFTGNLADYTIQALDANGNVVANPHANWAGVYAVRVSDNIASRTLADGVTTIPGDGKDILIGVEQMRFADQTINPEAYFDIAPTLDLHYVAQSQSQTIASDNFTGFTGNAYGRGSGWAANWSETGDNNSSGSGQILVDAAGGSTGLHITGGTPSGSFDGATVSRMVDLSAYQSVQLSFTVNESGLAAAQTVQAVFDPDGGGAAAAVVLATYNSSTNNAGTQTFNLTGPFTSAATLSFVSSAMNSTTNDIYIDNISITRQVTVDQFPGNNYTTNYTEQQTNPPSIALTPLITDPDDTLMKSANVHIRETIVGDQLNVGSLPSGITATGSGTATVVLTSALGASKADFQTALSAITFSNPTNDNPTSAQRHVDVTVSDGLKNSNLATTTISVTPVDDPGNAVADAIVTNFGGSNSANTAQTFAVPDWALLTNDSDPDSNPSINSVANNSSSLQSVSHSSQTVTVHDNATLGGSFSYTLSGATGPNITTAVSVSQQVGTTLAGTVANEILIGTDATTTFNGGDGNDVLFANGGNDSVNGGAGDDTIVYAVTTSGAFGTGTVTSGRDIIDGGANATTNPVGDRFILNGTTGSETFRIFSNKDDWDNNAGNGIQSSAAHAGITGLAAGTEIVITRGGTINNSTGALSGATVLAELSHIEEITVNTLDVTANDGNGTLNGSNGGFGSDSVSIIGNFTGTSLNYSTITVNDEQGGSTGRHLGAHLRPSHRVPHRRQRPRRR